MRLKDYFCKIAIGALLMLGTSCFIDLPYPVTFDEAVGIYQRFNNDSILEYIILNRDTVYSHVKIVNKDTMCNTGMFEVATGSITGLHLFGFDDFGDDYFNVHWDCTSMLVFSIKGITNNWDSWLRDKGLYKICNPALDENFCPDTVANNIKAKGFYLCADYNPESLNYIIVSGDGTYTHHYVSKSDTLCHTGSWQMLQVRESWWYIQKYILFHNWHSYGIEKNYYLRTYGGDRVAKINSNEIDLEPGLSELTFFKYKSIDDLMSRRWGDFLTEETQKYLHDSVFAHLPQ